jgi:hypothetical protein
MAIQTKKSCHRVDTSVSVSAVPAALQSSLQQLQSGESKSLNTGNTGAITSGIGPGSAGNESVLTVQPLPVPTGMDSGKTSMASNQNKTCHREDISASVPAPLVSERQPTSAQAPAVSPFFWLLNPTLHTSLPPFTFWDEQYRAILQLHAAPEITRETLLLIRAACRPETALERLVHDKTWSDWRLRVGLPAASPAPAAEKRENSQLEIETKRTRPQAALPTQSPTAAMPPKTPRLRAGNPVANEPHPEPSILRLRCLVLLLLLLLRRLRLRRRS